MGQSTVSGIVKEAVRAIYNVMRDEYLKFPCSLEEWKAVAHDFNDRWNFPNCLGAMDGKHFVLEHPLKSGSMYYNYKNTFSIALLAIVDAKLRFIFIDAGATGRVCDRGIWNNSNMKKYLEINDIPHSDLPGTNIMFPSVIVGDEGFTLSPNVMIPFPKALLSGRDDRKIFNYRLSRARRCSENAFEILTTRFKIFRAPMRYDPQNSEAIILATCALHNWLRSDVVGCAMYSAPQYIDSEDVMAGTVQPGDWRNLHIGRSVVGLANQGGNRHPGRALMLRDTLCNYFNGVGAVPWQDKMIRVPQ